MSTPNFLQIKPNGINLPSNSSTVVAASGDLAYNSSVNKYAVFNTAADFLVTESTAANTIVGLTNSNLSGSAAISNANLAQMTSYTVKANNTGSSATPTDVALGTVTEVTSAVLTLTGWSHATIGSPTIQVSQASSSTSGYLSSTDWNTFNNKQASGNYITALTGAITASGPGSAVTSLVATTNSTLTTLSALSLPTSQLTGVLSIANGGTDNGSLPVTAGGVLYTDGTKVQNSGAGTSGYVLQSNGSSAPTWASVLTNPMTTGGDMIYGGASGVPTRLANGTTGQLLTSQGGTSAPTWTSLKAPTTTALLSTGSQSGVAITVATTTITATAGATYTNNGNTYTLLNSPAASTGPILFSGTGTTSGTTFTKSTGTGPATIVANAANNVQTMATYTAPSGPAPLYLKIRLVGAGGGGSGGGSGGGTGGFGGWTIFGSAYGAGGLGGQEGGGASATSGGAASLGGIVSGIAISGGSGSGLFETNTIGTGTMGAVSAFGGAAGDSSFASATNSGSGGAGGASHSNLPGNGGAAGGYVDGLITSVSSTYYYAVGPAGAGGSAGGGTSPSAGTAGGSGVILIQEYYQ